MQGVSLCQQLTFEPRACKYAPKDRSERQKEYLNLSFVGATGNADTSTAVRDLRSLSDSNVMIL